MERANSDEMFGYGDEYGYDAVVVGSGYGGSVAACRMSIVGIKVCLIEKGRRWEAEDFPTDSLKIMSAARIDNRNLGFSFGSKDALFQVYEQGDSLAAMACGLGGGSLVNAAVMVPTPVRARRNPKWPKDWEKNWDVCEASASAMLKPQSVPVEFPNAKIMRQIADEEIEENSHSSINLAINFKSTEETTSKGSEQMSNCLACGNCLSGCPYNAKGSTDKNYLVSAAQAGCTIKTECQVQYIVRNPDEVCEDSDELKRKRRRRWRVYFNEIDYITSDFVVISAGVFGTAEILFKSEQRGLSVSERLGFGFSCNGNNVAYLAGSSAPLRNFGLNKNQFSEIPFQDRPGPSISSSCTSSLGFTVQSTVLPTSLPYLLVKGVLTYPWPNNGHWFLKWMIEKLKHMLGGKASQEMVLNVMGYDENDGRITMDKDTNKICFSPAQDPLLPRKIQTLQRISKRLGGILLMSKYRSTSVHLLGGCNAASDPSEGVCNPNGQVFNPKSAQMVHPGLYVCDASLIPCSVSINPCFTIATVAEHVSRHLVQDVLKHNISTQPVQLPIELLANTDIEYTKYADKPVESKKESEPRQTIMIKETMTGYIEGMPCTAYLTMQMNSRDRKGLNEKNQTNGKSHPLLRGRVGGYVIFKAMDKEKLHIIDGKVDLCKVNPTTPYAQYMNYHLVLASSCGSRYILEGEKAMNPYLLALNAWRESTTLHVTFRKIAEQGTTEETTHFKGELRVSVLGLLKSLISLEGKKKGQFIVLFLQSFLRTYILQSPRAIHEDFTLSDLKLKAYPPDILHEIKTEDRLTITCRQWKSSRNLWRHEGEKKQNPVLLINGHSTESYWLPTEPTDLVRTLLENGHETWLLQSRLHPQHLSNNITFVDIGKFDIPSVIQKICEVHGESTKVHVIAHCVGGLAIHIALMGGHVDASRIASLCCTNSSMFFKLTTLPLVKMRLPIIPISMVILGKKRIIPLFSSSKESLSHKILKSIARWIPRYERCTCDECEVLSGIFGNAFWHGNVSSTMHHWHKKCLPRLPLSAFPHLRKICLSGFIVDPNGKNKYLIHPERMAVHTLYISGGRTLLVTPQTSFLANQYMKLHQPCYRHTRVVVDGFGHSDLLIGEESYKRVFPHMISHIQTIDEGNKTGLGNKRNRPSKEPLSWGDDPYEAQQSGFGSNLPYSLIFWLFVVLSLQILVLLFL